jgi:hypothetical protein
MDQLLSELFGGNIVILLLALFIILCLSWRSASCRSPSSTWWNASGG